MPAQRLSYPTRLSLCGRRRLITNDQVIKGEARLTKPFTVSARDQLNEP
jgi:hypothetical protein